MKALIGHRRFIGRNLARQRTWEACFNLQHIDTIRGCIVERVIWAGLTSNRRLANGNPCCNRSNTRSLANALSPDARSLQRRSLGCYDAELISADHTVDEIRQRLCTLARLGGPGC